MCGQSRVRPNMKKQDGGADTHRQRLTKVIRVLLAASLCKGFGFQCTIGLLTFFLQQNTHVTEEASFTAYGIYGILTPILLILIARAVDRLPAFHLIVVGTTLSVVVRLLILLWQQQAWVAVILAAVFMSVADGIGSVGMTLAMKRIIYATYAGNRTKQEQQLDFYMSVDYGLSNLGAALASLCFAGLRHVWPNDYAGANAVLLLLNIGIHVAVLALVFGAMEDVGTADQSMQDVTASHCMNTCRSRDFWAYMIFCSLLIPVRTLFRHLDLTVPAFLTHAIGTHADFPYIQAINPVVTLVGVAILATVRYHYPENALICRGSKYWAIVAGTLLCAGGFMLMGLLLAVAPQNGPMINVAIGILVFTVGEVYWSSIFTSYALGQALEGQEASYTALVSLPALAVKLPTSLLSNALIQHYCPPPTPPSTALLPCDGTHMWLVIGAIALITPVSLIVGVRCLNRRLPQKQRYVIVS